MSRNSRIKEVIYGVLKDGKPHKLNEIQQICINKNIVDVNEKNSVRGAIFSLKKEDKTIVAVGRGEYIKKNIKEFEEEKLFEDAVKNIEKKIDDLRKLNWITSSDETLNIARKQVEMLKKVSDNIENLILGQ